MPNFREFFNNYKQHKPVKKKKTSEDIFEEVVGNKVSSLDGFISWLVLNEHIKSFIKTDYKRKPVSIFNLPTDRKILYLTKKVPNISNLVTEFNQKWQK